jgi:hypothetical protein
MTKRSFVVAILLGRNIIDLRGIRAWHRIYYRYVRSIPPD